VIAVALVATFLGRAGFLQTTAAGELGLPSVVAPEVYDALAASPDGRVYVIVLLDGFFSLRDVEEAERAVAVQEQQQAVLGGFSEAEFELVHQFSEIQVCRVG